MLCQFLLYDKVNQLCVVNCFSRVQLFVTLCTVAFQAPLSMGFSKQEYWSQLPFPPPGDLPNPGIEPASLTSPALAARFFTTSTTWKHVCSFCHFNCFGFVFVRSFFLPFLFFVLLRFDELYCCVWTPFLCVYCRFSVCDYNEVLIQQSIKKKEYFVLSFSFQMHFQYPALSSSHSCQF